MYSKCFIFTEGAENMLHKASKKKRIVLILIIVLLFATLVTTLIVRWKKGIILSGTAIDEKNMYMGIESIFVNSKNVLADNPPEIWVKFKGEESVKSFSVKFKNNTIFNLYGDKDISFKYKNQFPYGFKIIGEDGRVYKYNKTRNLSGIYHFEKEDIIENALTFQYKKYEEMSKEDVPIEVEYMIESTEEYKERKKEEEDFYSFVIQGDDRFAGVVGDKGYVFLMSNDYDDEDPFYVIRNNSSKSWEVAQIDATEIPIELPVALAIDKTETYLVIQNFLNDRSIYVSKDKGETFTQIKFDSIPELVMEKSVISNESYIEFNNDSTLTCYIYTDSSRVLYDNSGAVAITFKMDLEKVLSGETTEFEVIHEILFPDDYNG